MCSCRSLGKPLNPESDRDFCPFVYALKKRQSGNRKGFAKQFLNLSFLTSLNTDHQLQKLVFK